MKNEDAIELFQYFEYLGFQEVQEIYSYKDISEAIQLAIKGLKKNGHIKGHWKRVDVIDPINHKYVPSVMCSECNVRHKIGQNDLKYMNYCFHCGIEMEGEE